MAKDAYQAVYLNALVFYDDYWGDIKDKKCSSIKYVRNVSLLNFWLMRYSFLKNISQKTATA